MPEEATQPSARKPMSPSERARHASLVRWGKEQPFAARLEAVRQRRKAAKQKRAKGKGKAPKATAAEKEAERQKNIAAVAEQMAANDAGISKGGMDALGALAGGTQPSEAGGANLAKMGLMEQGKDGAYRLTPAGRAALRAAEKGDYQGAIDAIAQGQERATAQAEKEEKAPKGGGGGGKEKPTEEEKEQEKAQKKADSRAAVAAQMAENDVGVSPRGLEALASLASGEQVDETLVDGLAEMGLVEVDSEGNFRATTQGRSAVRAAERGDYGATIDAVSRAKERKAKQKEREQAKRERQAERRRREDERRAKEDERRAQEDEEDGGRRQRDDETPRGPKPRDNRGPTRPGQYQTLGKSADVKHGAHDQSSHGRGRRGGGGRRSSGRGKANRAQQRKRKREIGDLEAQRKWINEAPHRRNDPMHQATLRRIEARLNELRATKAMERDMSDYTAVIEDMEALRDEIEEIAQDTDLEIKAGRRNNRADQEDINRGYAMAEELCEIFEALGAETGEDEEIEGKGVNYDQAAQLVRDAWVQQMKPASDSAPYPWPQAVFDDGVVTSQDGCLYFVPYQRTGEGITFAARDQWKVARQTYITADGDVKAQGTIKGIETLTFDGEEIATLPGYSIKAIGAGQTEGYLVRFGGDGDLSEWRDMFDRDTDYGRATKSDVWVHHRMLPGLGKRRLTNQADIGMDDEGVFIKHLLDLRSSYERKLYDLAQQGKLGWSSGTAPHLVERKALGDGRHKIEQWPLGLDASYTPMPAGGFGVEARASAMKSLFADAGIDLLNAIYDNPEVDEPEEARPDAVKASDAERSRRLLLLTELELAEATI